MYFIAALQMAHCYLAPLGQNTQFHSIYNHLHPTLPPTHQPTSPWPHTQAQNQSIYQKQSFLSVWEMFENKTHWTQTNEIPLSWNKDDSQKYSEKAQTPLLLSASWRSPGLPSCQCCDGRTASLPSSKNKSGRKTWPQLKERALLGNWNSKLD